MFPRPVAAPYGTGGYEDYGMEEDRAGNFNFWETLQVIVGRKFLIAAIVLLGMLAATVITLRSTPLYRAQATVEFQKTESQILEGASVEPIVVADAEYMATQFALLRSRSLAERVAEVLGLPGDPRYADQDLPRRQRLTQATGKILENLSISPEGKSRIGRVQFVSDNPQEAARIANAIAENFIETTLERKYNNTEYARRFLNERLVTTKQALEDSERRLVEYAEEQGILELNQENSSSSLDANSLIALNQELAMAQSERIDAEQKYIEARDNPNSRQLLESVDLQRLKATRSELVAEYQERLGEFKPDYPSMVQLKARIDSVEEEIAAERQTILVGLQGEFRAARATEVSLRVRVDELKAILQDARNRRIQYDIIRREVDTNRSQYEALLQRLKEVGIAGSVGSSQVSIVDMAQAPSVPFKPNLSRSLASAFALSLFFGVGLSYALAYIDDTIKTPEDLRNKLGLPPIGVIPKAEEGAGNIIKALDDPRSGISEGFFSARTALQFASPAGTPRSLLVTSTRPGEGKSSTSVSLATVIAKTGKRVLIIDADMRKPSFQTDGTESIGLSGLLTRDEMLRDHVVFAKPNLALLPSGMIPPNPAEILSSPRLADVIRQAEEMFDVVVVDSPPILSFTDAPTLGAACEAAVVVIQAGQIRRPAAQRTVSRLLESRSNVIGGILTKFDVRKAGYDYGYYHYAYGKSAYAYGNERMTDSSREKRKINLFHDDDDGPMEDLSEEA
ncbi:GumC family protein [Parvularcula marina]|uniref:non-specific protein-tyrosine kinase n=2 Tax=Parvularcula marina TaxID=2292771 RepID=A0A371RGC2_9PROT|nr:polysaccharide biosynthesis tyrosine autokinase [Parvularcula marina]RFB04490.1 capsular biosynthesis protein [Parvularcula marina]